MRVNKQRKETPPKLIVGIQTKYRDKPKLGLADQNLKKGKIYASNQTDT
jgi:hypothetical protein